MYALVICIHLCVCMHIHVRSYICKLLWLWVVAIKEDSWRNCIYIASWLSFLAMNNQINLDIATVHWLLASYICSLSYTTVTMSLMCIATAILFFSQFYDIYSSYAHSYVATQIYSNLINMSIITIALIAMSIHGFSFCKACIVDPGHRYSMKSPNGPVIFSSPKSCRDKHLLYFMIFRNTYLIVSSQPSYSHACMLT